MQANPPIYLDYNATTPIDPRVADAMMPFLQEHFGNPSSSHIYGRRTHQAIQVARQEIAQMLGCQSQEVLLTSGGTESNNTVIKGVAERRADKGKHIITSAIEHPAVEEPCRWLETKGWQITRVGVDSYGRIDPEEVQAALTDETVLISIMHANNEVGTIQPIETLCALAKQTQTWVHTDASQSIGKVPIDVADLGVDFLTLAGHKFYAHKGVGALYCKEGRALPSFMHGAGHESGRRAGTENVLQVVGLGAAAALVHQELHRDKEHSRQLRDRLWQRLKEGLDDIQVHGHPDHRLPNTLHVGVKGITGGDFVKQVQEQVALSAGSACHAHEVSISSVLKAMQIDPAFAIGSLRLSVGRMSTEEDIEQAADVLIQAIHETRDKR